MSQISQDVIWHKKSSLLANLTCLGRPLPFGTSPIIHLVPPLSLKRKEYTRSIMWDAQISNWRDIWRHRRLLLSRQNDHFFYRLFPSCPMPLFQSETKCKAIDMTMSFYCHAFPQHDVVCKWEFMEQRCGLLHSRTFFRIEKEKAGNHFLSERFFTSPYSLESTKDNNRFFGPSSSGV